jgi:hypothetical protein
MKRWLLILGPLAVTLLLIYGGFEFARPHLEKWVLQNLESFSRQKLPVIIQAQEFHLQLILPRAELRGIRVLAKPELGVGDLVIEADDAIAKLDVLQLLAGRLQLGGLVIDGLGTDLDLDQLAKGESENQPIDWKPIFKILGQIPISRLALKDIALHISSKKMNLRSDILDTDLLLVNEGERLQIRLDMQDADMD